MKSLLIPALFSAWYTYDEFNPLIGNRTVDIIMRNQTIIGRCRIDNNSSQGVDAVGDTSKIQFEKSCTYNFFQENCLYPILGHDRKFEKRWLHLPHTLATIHIFYGTAVNNNNHNDVRMTESDVEIPSFVCHGHKIIFYEVLSICI